MDSSPSTPTTSSPPLTIKWLERRINGYFSQGRIKWRTILLNDPCPYCGKPSQDVDHIHPRAKGGVDGMENRVGICKDCNLAKGPILLLPFLVLRQLSNRKVRALRKEFLK